MAAYVISEVEVLDETRGRRYRELAAASIARHGGRYLARGAAPVVAEGEWPATCRLVIVEFPTMERLQAWYESADYAEALAVRQTALARRLLFVDGAHIAPGLGWPDTGKGQPRQPRQPARSSPARSSPARSSPARSSPARSSPARNSPARSSPASG